MTYSETLKKLMDEKGLGLIDLSRASKVPLTNLSRYASGPVVPGLAIASAIAKALGVSLDEWADCTFRERVTVTK